MKELPTMLRNLTLIKIPKIKKTESGIELPDNARPTEKIPLMGEVVAVGPECSVSKGDEIYYNMLVGQTLPDDEPGGDDYDLTIVSEDDIYCYFPGGKNEIQT